MSDSSSKIIKAITHYQENLERYWKKNEETKMLHCISRLNDMPIRVAHLEETGVGRTVNAMRKLVGNVGDAARSLVNKWKEMVEQDEEDEESELKHKSRSSSSHDRDSDQYEEKIKLEENRKEKEEKRRKQDELEKAKKQRDKEERQKREEEEKKKNEERERKEKERKRQEEKERKKQEEKEKERLKREEKERHRKEEKERLRQEEKEKKKREEKDRLKQEEREKKRQAEKEKEKEKKRQEDKERKRQEEREKEKRKKEESSSKKRNHEDDSEENEHRKRHKSSKDEKDRKLSHHTETHKNKRSRHSSSSEEEEVSSYSGLKNLVDNDSDSDTKPVKKIGEHKKSKSREEKSSKKAKKKKSVDSDEGGIGCESGTSFADALGMLEPIGGSSTSKTSFKKTQPIESPIKTVKQKPEVSTSPSLFVAPPKPEPLDLNISSLLPTISTNYKPLGNLLPIDSDIKKKQQQLQTWDDEDLTRLMYSKNQRTKVYSGNKSIWGKIPTLFELCIRLLQDNIDALEFTGGVPFDLLKPVLEKATPEQLFTLEHHNPYLIEDTDELWNFHCQREFRNKRREELETAREMYMRCLDERERKLKALTANIKLSQDKSIPVRQTKLAYVDSMVKPPRNILKKQIKNGIDKKPAITPSARLTTLTQAAHAGATVAVPLRGGNSSQMIKPKKAPLMAKTLQLMKGRFRR